MKPSRAPVLLTGVPRSGTTWVGRVFTADPSVFEIYEPFNPGSRELLVRYPARYLDAESPVVASEDLRRAVEGMLALRLGAPRGLDVRRPRRLLRDLQEVCRVLTARARTSQVVIKDPTAAHLTAWLHREFGVKPGILIRHPCGNAAGLLRMGWSGVSGFLDRPGWAAQLRPDDRDYLRHHGAEAKGDPVLSAALAWRATNGMLVGLRETIADLVVVRYEDLVADPAQCYPALAADLGLPWGKANVMSLDDMRGPALDHSALGSVPHVLRRDPVAAAWSWRDRLSKADIDRVFVHAGPLAEEFDYHR